MVAYGSGLSAQIGFGAETTVGTAATVTRFYEFLSESIKFEPTWLESEGLKAGQAYKRAARTVQSRFTVSGDVAMEYVDRGGMGLLWRHGLGSQTTTGTQIGTTGAYQQVHTAGSKAAIGLTGQVGRPQTNATVKPFTYSGLKIPSWEFSVSDGEIAQLKLTFDGWNLSTAISLTTASYDAAATPFTFADASTFTLGGTVSTTAGLTSVSGGVAVVTVVKGFTLSGESPMAVERFGLGNLGIKKEQIENGIPTITGSLDAEFADQAELYDVFKSNTSKALQLDLAHGTAGIGQPFRLSLIMPSVKFKMADVAVDGPDIVGQSVDFEAYDDGTNPVLQVRVVSTDTTL